MVLENSLSYDEVVVKKIIEDSVRPSFICEVVKSVSKKKYDGHNRAEGGNYRSLYPSIKS